MRVTKHDGGQTRSLRILVEFREVVKHTDRMAADLHEVVRGKAVCPTAAVVVAADRANRRKSTEGLQDCGVTDVTTVNDEVGTSQRLQCRGPD
jgi:hypothetical protein